MRWADDGPIIPAFLAEPMAFEVAMVEWMPAPAHSGGVQVAAGIAEIDGLGDFEFGVLKFGLGQPQGRWWMV